MRYLCALLLLVLLPGCGKDPDDRRFFGHGWVHPKRDLDEDMDPTNRRQKKAEDTSLPGMTHPDKYSEDPFVN